MKRMTWIPLTLSLVAAISACNNSASGDAAKTADSANEAKADSSTASSNPSQTMSVDEKTSAHMVKLGDAGLAEVALGQLAQEKGTSQSVKDFGSMMVKDHSAANDELKGIASRKNVTLPAAPGEDHQKQMQDLTKKSGAEFDKDYIDAMVKGHEKVANELEETSKDATDAEVKAFADKILPTVRAHLEEAKKIKKALK
jgi:putative membrane protein